ncbi:hypothetical protein [Ensifer sp. NM-2]|uniref:hypothetical protein n=1 Tax=Ensifer sp. NM-2 TaxID=2109730 RepID=UPI0011B26DCD|nr:hypothetical protein [Ensifer sp. NM-2]
MTYAILLASKELLATPMFQSFFRRRSIDIRRDGCQKGNIWTLQAFGRNQFKIWYGGDFLDAFACATVVPRCDDRR